MEPEAEENKTVAGSVASDSDDESAASASVKPYSVLLQSLNANVQRGQPQKKKRKVEAKESLKPEDDLNEDPDLVEELEESEFPEFGDAEDADIADEPNDAEDSKLP